MFAIRIHYERISCLVNEHILILELPMNPHYQNSVSVDKAEWRHGTRMTGDKIPEC